MAITLEKLWDDLRTNLVGLLLASLFGGGLLTAIAQAVRTIQNHPLELRFIWIVFVISALALAVIMLLAARPKNPIQQQTQTSIPQVEGITTVIATIDGYFNRIDRRFTDEIYGSIRQQANQVTPGPERDNYFVRALTVALIYSQLENVWYNIFGSQIRALQRLNTGALRREDLFPFTLQRLHPIRVSIQLILSNNGWALCVR